MTRIILTASIVAIAAGLLVPEPPSRDEQFDVQKRAVGLTDDDVVIRTRTAEWLGGAGPMALPTLIDYFRYGNRRTRELVCLSLSRMGPDAAGAVPVLVRTLEKDPESRLRHSILATFRSIGTGAGGAVPLLHGWLGHSESLVQMMTFEALSAIGEEAMPALIEALGHGDPAVRHRAALAIAQSESKAALAITPLLAATRDSNAKVRRASFEALGTMGAQAVPALRQAIRESRHFDQVRALATLARIGPDAADAAVDLAQLVLNADHPTIRFWAAKALAAIGSKAVGSTESLTQALGDSEPDVRWQAAIALGRIGPPAESARPDLTTLLDDPSPYVRLQAAIALIQIDPEDAEGRATLVDVLQTGDDYARSDAAYALVQLVPTSDESILDALSAARMDSSVLVRTPPRTTGSPSYD